MDATRGGGVGDGRTGEVAFDEIDDVSEVHADLSGLPPNAFDGGGKTHPGETCGLVSSLLFRRSRFASSQSANLAKIGAGLSWKYDVVP